MEVLGLMPPKQTDRAVCTVAYITNPPPINVLNFKPLFTAWL